MWSLGHICTVSPLIMYILQHMLEGEASLSRWSADVAGTEYIPGLLGGARRQSGTPHFLVRKAAPYLAAVPARFVHRLISWRGGQIPPSPSGAPLDRPGLELGARHRRPPPGRYQAARRGGLRIGPLGAPQCHFQLCQQLILRRLPIRQRLLRLRQL